MHYSLRSSLRFASNAMLRDYFEPRALLQDIQWDGLGEANLDEVHEAIRSLPDASFREINNHFRAIWEMATREYTPWLIQVAREQGIEIAESMQRQSSAYERAFRVFLDHPEVFEEARALAHWASLPRRSTEKRNGMPRMAPPTDDLTLTRFGAAISEYYQQSQGRGEYCLVEHTARAGHIDYFFA